MCFPGKPLNPAYYLYNSGYYINGIGLNGRESDTEENGQCLSAASRVIVFGSGEYLYWYLYVSPIQTLIT